MSMGLVVPVTDALLEMRLPNLGLHLARQLVDRFEMELFDESWSRNEVDLIERGFTTWDYRYWEEDEDD